MRGEAWKEQCTASITHVRPCSQDSGMWQRKMVAPVAAQVDGAMLASKVLNGAVTLRPAAMSRGWVGVSGWNGVEVRCMCTILVYSTVSVYSTVRQYG